MKCLVLVIFEQQNIALKFIRNILVVKDLIIFYEMRGKLKEPYLYCGPN